MKPSNAIIIVIAAFILGAGFAWAISYSYYVSQAVANIQAKFATREAHIQISRENLFLDRANQALDKITDAVERLESAVQKEVGRGSTGAAPEKKNGDEKR